MVTLVNPGNPTGVMIPRATIEVQNDPSPNPSPSPNPNPNQDVGHLYLVLDFVGGGDL